MWDAKTELPEKGKPHAVPGREVRPEWLSRGPLLKRGGLLIVEMVFELSPPREKLELLRTRAGQRTQNYDRKQLTTVLP